MNYFDVNQFRSQAHAVVDMLADHLTESLQANGDSNAPNVLDFVDPDELYQQWRARPLGGVPPTETIRQVMQQSIRLHHPRYAGHQISPPAPSAAVAALACALLNNGMGVYEMGMAGTVLERIVIETTAERMGFDSNASGVLTSGGSLGNLTALLAARHSRATEDITPAIMVSDQAHYCIQRATQVMGWQPKQVVTVPCNDRFQLDATRLNETLQQATDDGMQVIAVVGCACSTATGSYDPLAEIGEFCQANDLWFHVDGAHGAAAAFSDKYRDLVGGIEQADSVVLDYHKMLLVPALATAVIFRNGKDSWRTFSQKAAYLFSEEHQESQWYNLALRTFECTKLMISLKVYSVLAEFGLQAWNDNVTRLYDTARKYSELARDNDRIDVLLEPESNIVCYRYLTNDDSVTNEVNRRIRLRMLNEGRFYIVQTVVEETHWLRSTFGSAATAEVDCQALINEVERLGKAIEHQLATSQPPS